jgi:hypothetical protein
MKGARTHRVGRFVSELKNQFSQTYKNSYSPNKLLNNGAKSKRLKLGIFGGYKVGANGYTITETLIFLAVSGALFASAFILISGRQARAEFQYGIREFSSQIQDVMNDVSTGYYYHPGSLRCTVGTGPSAPLVFTPVSNEQGANKDCIFIGRVIQFTNFSTADGGEALNDGKGYRTFSIAGKRLHNGRPVTNLDDADPQAIYRSGAASVAVDATTDHVMPYGLKIKSVEYSHGATMDNVVFVGFFTDFAGASIAGDIESGARNVDVIPINTGNGDFNKNAAASQISNNVASGAKNPDDGVKVCVENSAGSNHAFLEIGGNLRQLTTNLNIYSGACP